MRARFEDIWWSGGKGPLIFNLGIRWNWVVRLVSGQLYIREDIPMPIE